MRACAKQPTVAEIDHILAEITDMNKEHIPFSTQVVVIEVELKKWKERLLTQASGKDNKMLQQLFNEGMLDITVLLPEKYFDEIGTLKQDLPENYADDEIHVLHMHEVTGITMPGYCADRRLSDANFEWEHVESADFHHPSVMRHLESQQ